MTETIEQLRAERDRWRKLAEEQTEARKGAQEWWLRASEERDALSEKLTETTERMSDAWDLAAAAWDSAGVWREHAEEAERELEEERRERDALVRLEVDRLTGREAKPRGRPPIFGPDSEAEIERRHRDGASTRAIAAELGMGKTQVHRVIARVRRQQEQAAERARLEAVAAGRSPAQRAARAEDFDPAQAERGHDYVRTLDLD